MEREDKDEGIFPPLSTFVCCREMRFFHLENGKEGRGKETDAAGSDDAHAPAANHCQYFFIVFALSLSYVIVYHVGCSCKLPGRGRPYYAYPPPTPQLGFSRSEIPWRKRASARGERARGRETRRQARHPRYRGKDGKKG